MQTKTALNLASNSATQVEEEVGLRFGKDTWRVRSRWQHRLFGVTAPDWFDLERDPRAVRVKQGHARRIWRVTLDQGAVYAKVFDCPKIGDRLKRWIGGGAAEREWRVSKRARMRGVKVVPCLAVGTRAGNPARTVVLSKGLDRAENLAISWERGESTPKTNDALIAAAARLCSQAHERGFVHGDGHPDNILIREDPPGEFDAYYLDVHSAAIGVRAASERQTVDALAQLDQFFHRRATAGQRLRFLRSYLAERPSLADRVWAKGHERKFLSELARKRATHAERLARTRDHRLGTKGGTGKYFAKLVIGNGWAVRVALRLERRHLFPEPDVPDRTTAQWRSILGPLLAGIEKLQANAEPTGLARLGVELQRIESPTARFLARLMGSAHRRVFEQCHRLRHRDVPSELILACGEHRRYGMVDLTVLIRPKKLQSPTGVKNGA